MYRDFFSDEMRIIWHKQILQYESSFMVPGEGAVANMTGNDYVIRENYLRDLTEIVKENDEEKATLGVLHFKIEEVDEEGNKVNYTEGETNEQMAMKDEVAMRLAAALCGGKWKIPMKGANILMIGDSYYAELEERVKICKLLAKKEKGREAETEIEGKFHGKKWRLTLEDSRIMKRIATMKSVTVTVKDVLSKVKIERLGKWMENFGTIHKIAPKYKEVAHAEIFEKDENIPDEEKKILLDWCKRRAESGPDVEIQMDLKVSIPMILPINNWYIEISHEDQVPQCQNCYHIGHYTSRCMNKKTQFRTYSSFANKKWGSEEELEKINSQRKLDTIRHKATVTRLLGREVKPENIKTNRAVDQSTATAIITKVKEDLELRYKNRSKYHAKSEVFERIKIKLNEIRETDGKDLTEKGKMLKELLENRRKKIGEMRNLRLPINLNEIATKYNQSLIYITVRDIMTFKDNVADTPMDTGRTE